MPFNEWFKQMSKFLSNNFQEEENNEKLSNSLEKETLPSWEEAKREIEIKQEEKELEKTLEEELKEIEITDLEKEED